MGEGRIMLELIRKKKRNWLGRWLRICAQRILRDEGCARRYGKWESSRQKKISDDRQHHDKWTVSRYEREG